MDQRNKDEVTWGEGGDREREQVHLLLFSCSTDSEWNQSGKERFHMLLHMKTVGGSRKRPLPAYLCNSYINN